MSVLSKPLNAELVDVKDVPLENVPENNEPKLANDEQGERLYAGKYKSPEDLEHAHLEAQKKINEQGVKLKEFVAPDEYSIEVELPEETKKDLMSIAKGAQLTQTQFNTIVNQLHSNDEKVAAERELMVSETIKELGEDKVKRLDVYIDQSYPVRLAAAIKNFYKLDPEMAKELYAHREHALNVTLSVGNSAPPSSDNSKHERMRELSQKLVANPNDVVSRKEYENLAKSIDFVQN